MPWKIAKKGSQHCVHKENPDGSLGKEMHCYDNRSEALDYMKALYVHAGDEAMEAQVMNGDGPAIFGVALTNRPVLPLPDVSLVEQDGEQVMRVPFLKTGVFKDSRYGVFIITPTVIDKMLENAEAGRPHHGISLDLHHDPEWSGALAWFDKAHGGKLVKEKGDKGSTLLVGYGKPTSQRAADVVKDKRYVYASAEFHWNHEGVEVLTLSKDLKELDMSDIQIPEGAVLLSKDEAVEWNTLKTDLEKVKAELEKVQAERVELERQNAALMVAAKEPPIPDLPEAARVQLEQANARIVELEKKALYSQAEATIERAKSYRDSEGRAHSPVLLETTKKLLLGQPVETKDGAIKLESGSVKDVAGYFRDTLIWLLENLPGQVPMQTTTEPEDKKLLSRDADNKKHTPEDMKQFWTNTLFR